MIILTIQFSFSVESSRISFHAEIAIEDIASSYSNIYREKRNVRSKLRRFQMHMSSSSNESATPFHRNLPFWNARLSFSSDSFLCKVSMLMPMIRTLLRLLIQIIAVYVRGLRFLQRTQYVYFMWNFNSFLIFSKTRVYSSFIID